ncbi:hypothetical protein MKW98_029801 [Papaver atlanticum]|uniref:Cytochrome P450 n=1 Tax=Papaver atlanticum TaxID=357466 RepID=A0AAD4T4L5_9MAGN|nr:hypothetical protein MKW98_029801 [Papaver atlanticum]
MNMIASIDAIVGMAKEFAWPWSCKKEDGNIGGENGIIIGMVSVLSLIVISYWYMFQHRKLRLPPGPRGLPLIGNLLSLEPNLHVYFANLAEVYGPIVKLQVGSKIFIVVSSTSLTKEVLKDNDAIFANRDAPVAALVASYGGVDIGWSASNSEWRKLRKVFAHEMLSNKSLDLSYGLRREEMRKTVTDIHRRKIDTPINFGEEVFIIILNMIMGMLWGGTLQGEERSKVGAEFQKVIGELVKLIGRTNVSDVFPALKIFDIQGIEREAKVLCLWLDRIMDSVIDQRVKLNDTDQTCQSKESKKDFLQLLLELMEQKDAKTQITKTQLKALYLDIVVAGTETTSTTIEWVMTEMMQHPEIMERVQAELDQVVGNNNTVEESHLSKLHYLDAVVKETFRLHPVAPLLIPHSPSSSCEIGGYIIPKGATVFCNAWAMQRDAEAWNDPLKFQPERFLSDGNVKKFDYNGKNFNYLPFGSGRRICAGIPLAERMLTYVLASLLHSFDWELPRDTKLDVAETFGIALKKSTPLVVIPTPRLVNLELYM